MNRYYYDLHIHSCLSPCGDNENTPNNLVGMGVLNGLQIMALTDHNTCKNCPAFFKAARKHGIIPIPGMELTTAEDIHMVCLFPTLEAAMAFDEEISKRRIRIPNRTDIFGEQWIMDENDEIIGEEPDLLSNATTIPIEEAPGLVEHFGGVCYPAHIDREANGIISTLGTIPTFPEFSCMELHDGTKEEEYRQAYVLDRCVVVSSSDAHYLWDIKEKDGYLELEDEPYSSARVRENLIEYLRRGR
ncbi:MAG: PHP domain-containing protein [Clostridia bacterium]|nr:PHP domain-containing protein [Clostridia bacterium]